MELKERHIGDVVVLDLRGRLTLGAEGSVRLKDKNQQLAAPGGASDVD